ncbi:unnamed protein product, partial [Vitis vinifera]|uniref:Uncharacterized protein n=1 Tax=Vitis vinifera TaxID=29760 RepID=D7SW32_VITVI
MRRLREWVAYCRNDLGFGTVSRSFPEVLVCLDCRKLRRKVLQLSLEVIVSVLQVLMCLLC